jgi:hypothetical protein
METKDISPIYFYLPAHRRPSAPIPEEVPRGYVDNMSDAFFCNTSLNWTLQTYLRLREHNYPCRLVDNIPTEGIVIAFRGDIPFTKKPTEDSIFVTMLGDASWHPYAQVQIVQNPYHYDDLENTFFMNHWSQPGLIPRSEDRGRVFENVGYFGHPDQLADDLKTEKWPQFLATHDLNWLPVYPDSDRQTDYSSIDLIVAIRSFNGRSYDHKPASKLHNAWRAGVPAILGPESAYRQEGEEGEDYLEACTYDDLCLHIRRLCNQPALREKLRKRGRKRGRQIKPELQAQRWWDLLAGPVTDVYDQWVNRPAGHQMIFRAKRWLAVKKNSFRGYFSVRED